MASIDQLTRVIEVRPEVPEIDGVVVRAFGAVGDVQRWIEIRQRAFAREKLGVRSWTEADFLREFQDKWWWNPAHVWFAEATTNDLNQSAVGAIALAMRGNSHADAKPVVHWLAVTPRWQRRGVGRLLLATLETAVWDLGFRQIWLETHPAWRAAGSFYEACGYRPTSGG